MGLVHLKVRVLQQLLAQGLDEGGVALEEEVHRELLEQVGDVLLGGDVVDEGLHLDVVDKERLIRGSKKNTGLALLARGKWVKALGNLQEYRSQIISNEHERQQSVRLCLPDE